MSAFNRTEIAHNTPEQVLAYVNAALAIVAEVEAPDDLRAAVFAAAYAGVSSKQVMVEVVQPQSLAGMVLPSGLQ